ncbi:uncharacterized protein LOC126826653 isoform X1 [Patella vulgata]|uniref:uncharacterized protein LOC126826653 isoform X1 n=2 Tax=Patella vulgata TaxID=6465 RepID=UPI0021808C94|nr:uncharacterized protein LOC126826653 isoform X1 [Patella vulgata]
MQRKYGQYRHLIKFKGMSIRKSNNYMKRNGDEYLLCDQKGSVGMKKPHGTYHGDNTDKDKRQTTKNINNNDIPIENNHVPYKAVILVILAIIGPLVIINDLGFTFISHSLKSTFQKQETYSTHEDETGWHKADDFTLNKYSTDICSIERVSVHDISHEKFETEYKHKKPLIIQFTQGASDWTDVNQWIPFQLIEKYGSHVLYSGKPREIVRHGGNGDTETRLDYFINELMTSSYNASNKTDLYVFDRYFFKESNLYIKAPPYLEQQDGVDDSMFFLGASTSGVSFHKHAEGWNAVIFGQKRWFLYPKEKTPPGGMYPGYSQLDWFHEVYPKLDESNKPVECIQRAGDMLYLPESMYHSTINLGHTVAIGIQKIQAVSQIEKLFYKDNKLERQGLIVERLSILKKLYQLIPENAEVHLKLGSVYEDLSDIKTAEKYYQQAIDIDPFFLVAILNMARVKSKLNEKDVADTMFRKVIKMNPNMWDSYAAYGSFLIELQKFQEALLIFKKGCELQPNMHPFWDYLRYCQESVGDWEGAKHSKEKMSKLSKS